jgi:cytochrome c oxidase cbb3-type subunit 2
MAGELYKKPIMFAIVSAVVILIGTAVTMFIPMLTAQMHPKLENLNPYTALQLAGRDIYQREGCNNCHTQTVRPLRTEVMRYGEYSKAGEFAYDRPFLWGSKRTGPDLARIGKKYPDQWHYRHFDDPRKFFPQSNMPTYGWLKDYKLDPQDVQGHMDALGFPYSSDDISQLAGKNDLDALVAYVQVIGTAVAKKRAAPAKAMTEPVDLVNPLAGDAAAINAGEIIYEENCLECHGPELKGDIGPSLVDNVYLYQPGDLADDDYFEMIYNGTEEGQIEEGRTMKGGMPSLGDVLSKEEIWSVIAYIRSLQTGEEGK